MKILPHSTSIALIALLAGSCVPAALRGPARTPFTASSLDKNDGKPHSTTLSAVSPKGVADQLLVLARQRELTLVKQSERCDAERCALAFRSKPIDKRVFKASGTLRKSYYSRYFFTLSRLAQGCRVVAYGVPVFDGELGCPERLQKSGGCKPTALEHPSNTTLFSFIKKTWGYTIDAANEAELLTGLFAELPRALAKAKTAPPTSDPKQQPIVAVFDLDDQSKSLTATTRSQLSEYLATRAAQAGYKVVPREQLRTRLARQKKKSYRRCYDRRCQIELGKALAAQKVLSTKLLKLGTRCTLLAQLYDLKTQASERAASVKTACKAEALLGAVEALVRQLTGKPR